MMEFQTMEIHDVKMLKGWKNIVSLHTKKYDNGKGDIKKDGLHKGHFK
jgi:hypothetical protein